MNGQTCRVCEWLLQFVVVVMGPFWLSLLLTNELCAQRKAIGGGKQFFILGASCLPADGKLLSAARVYGLWVGWEGGRRSEVGVSTLGVCTPTSPGL